MLCAVVPLVLIARKKNRYRSVLGTLAIRLNLLHSLGTSRG